MSQFSGAVETAARRKSLYRRADSLLLACHNAGDLRAHDAAEHIGGAVSILRKFHAQAAADAIREAAAALPESVSSFTPPSNPPSESDISAAASIAAELRRVC